MAVIFLHIPKTAGTTLRQIIYRQYMPNDIYQIYTGDKNFSEDQSKSFLSLSEQDREKFKLIIGHISFGFHKQLLQDSSYAAVLRDPIERVISLYFHITTYSRTRKDQITLFEFLEKRAGSQANNHQTRIIAGINAKYGKCTKEILNIAKNNIRKHFCILGLMERFDESLILLRRELGWRTPFYVKDNVSVNKIRELDFTPDMIDLIKKHNEIDIELYKYAENLFNERIESQGDIFYKELEEFRIVNSFSSNWISPTTIWQQV